MKTKLYVFFVTWLALQASVFGQATEWVQEFDSGAGQDDFVGALAVDAAGNLFLAGQTDNGNVGPGGGADALLVKYDRDGNLQWSREFGAPEYDVGIGAYADASGNVYVSGQTWRDYLTNDTYVDAFLNKYSSDGTLLWEQIISSNEAGGWDSAHSVSGDGLGNIYVAGTTDGSFNTNNQGAQDVFVMKFDDEGNEIWTRQFGTQGMDSARGISADGLGNVFVAGEFDNRINSQRDTNPEDIYIAKYAADGRLDWMHQLGEPDSSERIGSHAVVADGLGNAYLAYCDCSLAISESASYLNKYSQRGDLLWSQEFRGVNLGGGMAVDASGAVYLQGRGDWQKYDKDGTLLWSTRLAAGPGLIAISESGDIYGAGTRSQSTSQSGTRDLLLVKVDEAALGGDVDSNGVRDVADVDLIRSFIISGQYDAAVDVNFDKTVDVDDMEFWVERLQGSYVGDANLDGEFNSGDLVSVFVAGEFEDAVDGNSTWATGDWNGDGDFTSSDFVFAFDERGYDRGPRASVAAVPEPTAVTHVLMPSILFAYRGRRRFLPSLTITKQNPGTNAVKSYRMFVASAAAAFSLIASDTSNAGLIRHDRPDKRYTDLAADPLYASVGLVRGDGQGSGTLIEPHWVLTAAHVGVSDETVFEIGGDRYVANDWIPHPRYSSIGDFPFDIALLRLSAMPPIEPAELYRGSNELGTLATLVGYGHTGNGLAGVTSTRRIKRAGQNVIDQFAVDFFHDSVGESAMQVDFDHPAGTTSVMGDDEPIDLEYLVESGDSGGGVFINEESRTYLAGVHSLVFAADDGTTGYGAFSTHVRISRHIAWIEGVLDALPNGTMRGDVDGNGFLDINDIHSVQRQSIAGQLYAQADLDFNGKVDSVDIKLWVHGLKKTYFGDSNLDGEFNSTDLLASFEAGQYEDGIASNSAWSTGDWNSDGEFDSSDLMKAFEDGGYEQGPQTFVAPVPEPSSWLTLFTVFLAGAAIWRNMQPSI